MRFLPLALVAAFLAAGPAPRAQEAPPSLAAAEGISLEQAVKMAEQRFKARVVRAETQQAEGHTFYILRLLAESGRVWTVRVDASSGAVL